MAWVSNSLDHPHAVARADLPPAGEAQHRRRVEQPDLMDLRLDTGVEPGAGAKAHDGDRISEAGVFDGRADPPDHVDFDRLEDRGEQFGLVGEMMIERPPADAGGPHDLLGPNAGIAARGE